MGERKDGGPAFPQTVKFVENDKLAGTHSWGGMSLRDYFAGQALMGQLAFSPHDSFEKFNEPGEVAAMAYRFADAMIRARSRTEEQVG